MTPSEIAELILPWAQSLNKDTFTNSEAYHAIDCIESPSDVSDALRYMFEHGMVARKKKDGKSYLYALSNNAPDDFDMHKIKPTRKTKEDSYLQQDEKISIEIDGAHNELTKERFKVFPTPIYELKSDEPLTHNHSEPDETADIGNTDNHIQRNLRFAQHEITYGKSSLTSWMTTEQKIGYLAQNIIDCVIKINENAEDELCYLKSARNHLDELIRLFENV